MRVLMVAKDLQLHGITNFIVSYYRILRTDGVEMDFAVGMPADEELVKEIQAHGGLITLLPEKTEDPKGYYKGLNRAMQLKQYDILHVNGNSATISVELFLGVINRIPFRIAHSHNTMCNHVWAHKLLSPVFHLMYTQGLACSELAGRWMFGKHAFAVIPNGFDTKKFIFNPQNRYSIRDLYGISENFVVGHIGFFNKQKNHGRIVSIFKELKRIQPKAKLLLVGDGYTRKDIEKKVEEIGIQEDVIFAGISKEIPQYLSAMDSFLFPSLFEGLGIVLLEAQINGLPCVLSDVVPNAAKLGENYYPQSLNASDLTWAEAVSRCTVQLEDRQNFYAEHENEISKYEITKNGEKLFDIYKKAEEMQRNKR